VTLSDNRVAGDVLTIAYTTASFADSLVGTAKPVSVTGITVTGTDAGNYTFNTTATTKRRTSRDLRQRPRVISSQNPSGFGQSVTFTATVTGTNGTPTGTVTFKDGATALATNALSGGQATLTNVLARRGLAFDHRRVQRRHHLHQQHLSGVNADGQQDGLPRRR